MAPPLPGTSDAPGDLSAWQDGRPLPASMLSGYQWPIRRARLTNSFGIGRPGSFVVDGRSFHDGIDLASFCGARIVAAHDGLVLAAGRHSEAYLGWMGDLGPFREKLDRKSGWSSQSITVVVDDGNGYRSIYAHLARTAVRSGDRVRAGDVIGYQGASGNATGCHLHYSLYSPLETRSIALQRKIADRTRLPQRQIARIDPLTVLPDLSAADISWGWGARAD